MGEDVGGRKVKSWSYSAWSQHEKCPAQYAYQRIDGLPRGPDGPALTRGTAIHEALERYLRHQTDELPSGASMFQDELHKLREQSAIPELEIVLAEDGSRVEWRSPVAWLRAKIDALVLSDDGKQATVIDFKTGQIYPEHDLQMELYAWLTLDEFSELQTVTPEFWYLDKGTIEIGAEYTRSALQELDRKWRQRGETLLAAKTFDPRPGAHCRWCPYNGDPCEAAER